MQPGSNTFPTNLESSFTFIEIFSGPKAPLSRAVAETLGDTSFIVGPGVSPGGLFDKVEASKMVDLCEVRKESPGTKKEVSETTGGVRPIEPENNRSRLEALQSGKQPSFGKRTQLIADGLNDPAEHLKLAKILEHPFDGDNAIKIDHWNSLEFVQKTSSSEVIAFRLSALQGLRELAEQYKAPQKKANLGASWTAKKLGLRIQTRLMEHLQLIHDIEDKEVPTICLEGINITGVASESPFFESFDVPPKMSPEEFHRTKRTRSLSMVDRVKRMALAGSNELSQAIYDKTLKEVLKQTMGPPMSWEEVDHLFGGDFQVVPSFGLEHGGTDAPKKFRRIDDHTASGNNLQAHRRQKVPMAMVDYLGALLRQVGKNSSEGPVHLSTEDMSGAYRQVPLAPSDVRYSVTGVFNPITKRVDLHLMYGQPFGAGHAVPNFCRVAEWVSRLLQRRFGLISDHFFDDFWLVEPASVAESGMFVLKETFNILGFALDADKSQPPADVLAVLGVLFNTRALQHERLFRVEAKPSRISNLTSVIDKVLRDNALSPALAASIVGKFGFLCSTLFGKVGRCCTAPLRHRQYSTLSSHALNPNIVQALTLMKEFLHFSPAREIKLICDTPLLAYTDASDVPYRDPRHVVGAVIFDPQDKSLEYSSWAVPQEVIHKWLPRENHMGQLELLAAPFALATWPSRFKDRAVLMFIDNNSAAANLVKGYSPQSDSAKIVGEFWLAAACLKTSLYIERVESKSNIADGPSRLDYSFLHSLGGIWQQPDTGKSGSPDVRPAFWFGTPNLRGEDLCHQQRGE